MQINSIGANNIRYEDYFSNKKSKNSLIFSSETKVNTENIKKIGSYWVNETDFDSLLSMDYTTVMNRARALNKHYKFNNYFVGVLIDRRV